MLDDEKFLVLCLIHLQLQIQFCLAVTLTCSDCFLTRMWQTIRLLFKSRIASVYVAFVISKRG